MNENLPFSLCWPIIASLDRRSLVFHWRQFQFCDFHPADVFPKRWWLMNSTDDDKQRIFDSERSAARCRHEANNFLRRLPEFMALRFSLDRCQHGSFQHLFRRIRSQELPEFDFVFLTQT